MPETPYFCCEELSLDLGGREVLRNISLELREGEVLGIIGPNGAGKTSLINQIGGQLEPSAGRIEVFGTPLVGINRRAGYMFQAESLMPWRTAHANVELPLQVAVSRARRRLALEGKIRHLALTNFDTERLDVIAGHYRPKDVVASARPGVSA